MFICAAIFVLILPLQLGLAKNNYDIILQNLNCQAVSKLNFLHCQLHRQRNPVASVQTTLNETIHQFEMQTTFDMVKKDKTRMNVADLKMDGCKFLGNKYRNNFIGRLLRRIKTFGNIPNSCPGLKGKLYEIRNYTFNSDEFPPGVPQSKWQIRLKLLTRSELVASVLFEGSVVYNT